LTMAAMTTAAAVVAAVVAAGRGGGAGGFSGAGRGRGAGRRFSAGGSGGAGRLTAARTSRLATTTTIEQTGLGVVGKQRNGATRQQQSKQNLRFHGESSKRGTGCLLRRHTPNPFQRPGDQFLIGSNRQTLRMALTGQAGFAICRLIAPHASCDGQRKKRF
jgi:hypothetical protein